MKKLTYAIFPFIKNSKILLAKTEKGLAHIYFGDDTHIGKTLNKLKTKNKMREEKTELKEEYDKILAYWENPQTKPDIKLDIEGTAFQKKVWEELIKIPAGKTATYTDIAKRIKKEKAVRAVANACAANKLPLIIPCHRVIRKDKTLGGYSGGLDIKEELLKKEKAI